MSGLCRSRRKRRAATNEGLYSPFQENALSYGQYQEKDINIDILFIDKRTEQVRDRSAERSFAEARVLL